MASEALLEATSYVRTTDTGAIEKPIIDPPSLLGVRQEGGGVGGATAGCGGLLGGGEGLSEEGREGRGRRCRRPVSGSQGRRDPTPKSRRRQVGG